MLFWQKRQVLLQFLLQVWQQLLHVCFFCQNLPENVCEHACGGNRRDEESVVEKCVSNIVANQAAKASRRSASSGKLMISHKSV
jgi:hypothetical protein